MIGGLLWPQEELSVEYDGSSIPIDDHRSLSQRSMSNLSNEPALQPWVFPQLLRPRQWTNMTMLRLALTALWYLAAFLFPMLEGSPTPNQVVQSSLKRQQ